MADGEALLRAAAACEGAERTIVVTAELLLAMLGSARGDYALESVHAHLALHALADGDDPALVAKVHSRLALTQFRTTGRFDRDQTERSIAMAQPEPGESIWTWTLMSLAYLHIGTAAFDVARMQLERMSHALEVVGDVTERPWVESYLTLLAALMGDMDAAERHCSIALSLTEHNQQITRSDARRAEAFVSLIRGDWTRPPRPPRTLLPSHAPPTGPWGSTSRHRSSPKSHCNAGIRTGSSHFLQASWTTWKL